MSIETKKILIKARHTLERGSKGSIMEYKKHCFLESIACSVYVLARVVADINEEEPVYEHDLPAPEEEKK